MEQSLVECIANYSEGRRYEVVDGIAAAIQSVAGVHILDRHSDEDHNRTVITFLGSPEAVEEAAFRSISKAAELINLDQHQGEHPRIGATDVVPFVPISGVNMQDCVAIAQRLGQRVGEELNIPVYLYEEAATRPDRVNLENIRRGEYEALKTEIGTTPDRIPDFGPAQVSPAGATVIGARHPLIAYNIYLNTDDLSVAKKVAQALRHSSGGLRYVKALGMLVEGHAQVSMNMTNFRATPVARIVEMARREAARYGVSIQRSELVGLIPQEALVEAATWYLQLDAFKTDQILENRLEQSRSEKAAQSNAASTGTDFLEALAAPTATPGGGSAAAYAGAQAAALIGMVARLTLGKKKYAAVDEQMQSLAAEADDLRHQLAQAVEDDAGAYSQVMAAYKLPKDSSDQLEARDTAIQKAILGAIVVPLRVAQLAVRTLELAAIAVWQGNINAMSDGGSAAALARAALKGAALNVRTNVISLTERSLAQDDLSALENLEARADLIEKSIQEALTERGGIR